MAEVAMRPAVMQASQQAIPCLSKDCQVAIIDAEGHSSHVSLHPCEMSRDRAGVQTSENHLQALNEKNKLHSTGSTRHLAACIFARRDDPVLFRVDEAQVVRLCSADHGGLDLVKPHAPKAAMPAIAQAILVGDAPSRGQHIPACSPDRESSAACMRQVLQRKSDMRPP